MHELPRSVAATTPSPPTSTTGGQIVGWAENGVQDGTCVDDQVLQFRAALWELKPNDAIKLKELRPYGDHATSAATAINDRGVAVGISGDCDQAVGRFSALEAVLWDEHGKPTRIPNLGGTTWHTPMDINAQGDVVGFSNPPGVGDPEGEFISHAFFWANGAATATDIGTLGEIHSARPLPSIPLARSWASPSAASTGRAPSSGRTES